MKRTSLKKRGGSTLVVALCVLTVISAVAAGVLANANARYNAGSRAVKGWKEALYAAEAGGDLAFNEIRKPYFSTPATPFASGWVPYDSSAPPPNPNSATAPDYALGYGNSALAFGDNNNLAAKVTVDKLGNLPGNPSVYYYRIRSLGIAQVFGLKRTGMNDALQTSSGAHFGTGTAARGNGDSLLRKIDYNYDHFMATYGFGDALPSASPTSSNGKASVSVTDANHGQVMRRVELVAVPVMPIEGAVKTNGGVYSFPYIDSYNSANGGYPGSNCAQNGTGCTAQQYSDSRNGNVVDGSSTFNGTVYGDVTTNGGNAGKNTVTGVVDNNVPVASVAPWPTPPSFPSGATAAPSTLTLPSQVVQPSPAPAGADVDSRQQRVFYYHYTSLGGITINPPATLDSTGLPASGKVEATVHILVDGNVTGDITVSQGVFAKVYFYGNASGKADSYDNENIDGRGTNNSYLPPTGHTATLTNGSTTLTSSNANFVASDVGKVVRGVGIPVGTTITSVTNSTTATMSNAAVPVQNGIKDISLSARASSWTMTTNTSAADHFWMIGEGAAPKTISLGSAKPQTNYVVWYAPNYDFSVNGNPDFVGAMVVKSLTGVGGNTMHFDKALLTAGTPQDYRIASYIEDVR